jgi:hypothetical protein
MRRLLSSLLALGFISALVVGCKHHAGVCDCDTDCNHCAHTAPWVQTHEPGPYTAPIPGPAPVQEVHPKISDVPKVR